jgi:uncharacterized protein (TIGR00296 family)
LQDWSEQKNKSPSGANNLNVTQLGDEDGTLLVSAARHSIERSFGHQVLSEHILGLIHKKFYLKCGAFVTLYSRSGNEETLRGCIGYPEPVLPLAESVATAAEQAAFHDPRFPPVKENELGEIKVEVSVLTEPKLLNVQNPVEYPKLIVIGSHGLQIKWAFGSGLLLPQVAIDSELNAEDFLCYTCLKAGALPDCWLLPGTQVLTFEAVIFGETSPKGIVRRKYLAPRGT